MTLIQLRQLSEEYDREHKFSGADNRSDRFVKLVEEYGVSFVAAATGLKESTVSQYARGKDGYRISEYVITKAETILNNK